MTKIITSILIASVLAGCAVSQNNRMGTAPKPANMPVMMQKEFDAVKPPANMQPITVAVYAFTDKTGQRRPQQNIASLSTAVTQGSETFLIKALGDVGQGRWFKVVERVGIDGLTRERQLIRQMREAYEGSNAKPLPPMTFAGLLIEGGIVGYDSSVKSGGMAARWLGIGPQTQYSEDIVTASLRLISVSTGEVLATVTVQKTIVSAADSVAAMKFFDVGTKSFEFETGMTVNEPGTFAVKSTIEMGVLELIKEGARKGIWSYHIEVKEAPKPVPVPVVVKEEPKPAVVEKSPEPVAEKKEQPKPEVKEEPKAEVKQEAKEESKDPAPKDEKPIGKHVTRTMYLNQDTVAQKLISKIKLHKGLKVQATKNVDSHTGWIYVDAGRGKHGWVKEYTVSESPAGTITKKGKHKK
jgi:curli production assembly/transport component CsgG